MRPASVGSRPPGPSPFVAPSTKGVTTHRISVSGFLWKRSPHFFCELILRGKGHITYDLGGLVLVST
jgi:hypothetical protein